MTSKIALGDEVRWKSGLERRDDVHSRDFTLPPGAAQLLRGAGEGRGQDEQAPSQSQADQNQGHHPFLSGLRGKLATFSMADWLQQLGLGPRQAAVASRQISAVSNYSSAGGDDESPTLDLTANLGGNGGGEDVDEEWLDEASWPGAQWLNLEPGRNYTDTLELQHFGPLVDLVPVGAVAPGRGHEFGAVASLANKVTWCDKCGDFIWGLYRRAVRCANCHYTCHYKCLQLVTLDCSSVAGGSGEEAAAARVVERMKNSTYFTAKSELLFSSSSTSRGSATKEAETVEVDEQPHRHADHVCTGQQLLDKLDAYNAFIVDNAFKMSSSDEDGLYVGSIQVHMNFTRPINVVSGHLLPSAFDFSSSIGERDGLTEEGEETRRRRSAGTITSFFLPRDTVKTVHVSSNTTTRQLIISLLRKFNVADNPRKFALYERRWESLVDGATRLGKLRRIADDACPLRLRLHWGADSSSQFVLQENETGDILWEAFEIPELNNFLRILELEEEQYVWQIRQRYNLCKYYMELELNRRRVTTQPN